MKKKRRRRWPRTRVRINFNFHKRLHLAVTNATLVRRGRVYGPVHINNTQQMLEYFICVVSFVVLICLRGGFGGCIASIKGWISRLEGVFFPITSSPVTKEKIHVVVVVLLKDENVVTEVFILKCLKPQRRF